MTLRVCAEPGCPELVDGGRCQAHARAKDKARGTRQQRGYGRVHDTTRKEWEPFVRMGGVSCWRCGHKIDPNATWDLGHDDADRTRYRGPEHVACNRATAGR